MTTRSDLKDILDWARKQGGVVTQTKSGHYKVRHPVTRRSVNIACTPGSARAFHTVMSRLRKIGFQRDSDRTTHRGSAPDY